MENQQVVQLPVEVANLIGVVAERYGYYFGRRTLASELMSATSVERIEVTKIAKKISGKVNEWMKDGTDTRPEIIALQTELVKARETLKSKSYPYWEKITPLVKAISYLDKVVIPSAVEKATGQALVPVVSVSDATLKAITKPSK